MHILFSNWGLYLRRIVLIFIIAQCLVFMFHPGRFAKNYSFIEKTKISKFLVPVPTPENLTMPLCPLVVNLTSEPFSLNSIRFKINTSRISEGGGWKPMNCLAQHKIAVIVPYRQRKEHLNRFLPYIHGFLQSQLIDYQIYVIEQSDSMAFNRGLLFNIGYIEVLKRHQIPCFIFHDVDLLPENIENIYGCTVEPRHISNSVNSLRYQLPYESLFGGVVSLLQAQFQMINGFPNRYFGWGGEDDDLYVRIVNRGMKIIRFEPYISRFYMLPHVKDSVSPDNLAHLENALVNQNLDGLSTIENAYDLLKVEYKPLCTLVKVNLKHSDSYQKPTKGY